MSRRLIAVPMGMAGTYYRLKLERQRFGDWELVGWHNQPFRSYEDAAYAAGELEMRAPVGHPVRVRIVRVTGS